MAYLNVRERRIEATIAYVGPALAGKATNLEHLEQTSPHSRIEKHGVGLRGNADTTPPSSEGERARLSLSWHPPKSARFRDCDVIVNVVAQRGGISKEHTDDVLREADGIVVVVDAHPSAQSRNRESLAAVRTLLAASSRADVPVVVQVNKTDLPDALAADDVVDGLEATALKHIAAAASKGDGVVETLEAALAEVLANLEDASKQEVAAVVEGPKASAAEGGHPLLAALRQVLRETVREHVEEMESRLAVRIDKTFVRLEESLLKKRGADEAAALARVEDHLVRRLGELEAASSLRQKELTSAMDARLRALDEVFDGRFQVLSAGIATVATRDDLTATSTRVDRVREDVRAEVIRALETRSRADREHLATATTGLKKAVDTLASDVRALDVRPQLTELTTLASTSAESLATVRTTVEGNAETVRALGPRVVRLDDSVRSLRTETAEGLHACIEQGGNLKTQVNDIVEELKKTKKGWFA